MLLISYDAENYQDHLYRWAHWKQDLRDGGNDMPAGAKGTLGNSAAIALGGRENILSPVTARGTQSRPGNSIRQFCPDGYDTEQALDFVITELSFMYPSVMEVIDVNFSDRGRSGVEVKAKQAGYTYSDFRRKLHEGKIAINTAMRFLILKPKTGGN